MADEETADDATPEDAEPEGGADEQGNRKTRTGTVVSDKMQKTVVVSVTRKFEHATYEKYVRDRQKYKAHDENERTKVGDKVLIEETRPISKDKRWRIREIIEEAPTV